MLSYESELRTLRDDGSLDDATATRLIALERRELVSLHTELRLTMWVAVLMIATAAGWYLARNYQRIGPAALIAIVAVAAAAAYVFAWMRPRHDGLRVHGAHRPAAAQRRRRLRGVAVPLLRRSLEPALPHRSPSCTR